MELNCGEKKKKTIHIKRDMNELYEYLATHHQLALQHPESLERIR